MSYLQRLKAMKQGKQSAPQVQELQEAPSRSSSSTKVASLRDAGAANDGVEQVLAALLEQPYPNESPDCRLDCLKGLLAAPDPWGAVPQLQSLLAAKQSEVARLENFGRVEAIESDESHSPEAGVDSSSRQSDDAERLTWLYGFMQQHVVPERAIISEAQRLGYSQWLVIHDLKENFIPMSGIEGRSYWVKPQWPWRSVRSVTG